MFSVDRRYRHLTKLDTTRIPYAVNRSASGNLPIYSKIRGVSRTSTTHVGAIYGDVAAFVADVRTAVAGDAPIREEGRRIEIDGRFARPLKKWLQSLGF